MTLRQTVILFCLVHLALSATIQKRDATVAFRPGCFTRSSSTAGCLCAEKDKEGKSINKMYDTTAECILKHDPQQIENKKDVLDELKTDVAGLKDGCYPRPSNIGCRCTEKDATGHDVAKIYQTDAECRKDAEQLDRRRRDAEKHHAGDGHDHSKSPIGANIHPSGATVPQNSEAGRVVRRVRRGDADLSAEEKPKVSEASVSSVDVKPAEIYEKATAIEAPVGGSIMPNEVAMAAAGGAGLTDESVRVPRHHEGEMVGHHEKDGHDHKGAPIGANIHPSGAAVGNSDQTRVKRHGDDGKPEHHEGDGHDHSKDKGAPIGANIHPSGAAVGSGTQNRLRRDVGAIPAGGADATGREAAMGASSGGSVHPTSFPKPEERPQAPALQSEAEAKVMGEVAEHIDESRLKREAVQMRDRPATAGQGVHGSKQHELMDQNVRDPVREKAAQNYQAVLNELKDKFRGLKEGCYPRPKGCLCVIGKDADGRDRTERRMKDVDCKCQPGERGASCPAQGA